MYYYQDQPDSPNDTMKKTKAHQWGSNIFPEFSIKAHKNCKKLIIQIWDEETN